MDETNNTEPPLSLFDCIIVGAGPGGLQAAIYLGRYRRHVLVLDRGGGRTMHARSIENFLGQKEISGKDLIKIGMDQAQSFGALIEKGVVESIIKKDYFTVTTGGRALAAKFVIVSSGVGDAIPPIDNLHRFFGTSFFTCVDCDGYKTTSRKLAVIGDSFETVRLAFAMKEMYTPDITLILSAYSPPPDIVEELQEQGIRSARGPVVALVGADRLEAVELADRTRVACEAVMANFGFGMNDGFLNRLDLKRDPHTRSFVVNSRYESSLSGLYIVGPLNTGNDQAVIAAGEGAVAAIDINKKLLEL